MLRLLRRLIGAGEDADTAAKPVSATSEILAKSSRTRTRPTGAQVRSTSEAPAEAFDPYNTGAFDRSSGWERIKKRGL